MAELPVEKLLISEVLQKISNAKTKKEKSALMKKARGYKYISPKTLRKLERLS